jgi:AcrR family transcriptional regulator
VLPPEERKEELLQAAAAVISEKGYRAAGVSDIIERAGVARGTFYHYFDSKKDIFLDLIQQYFDGFAEVLEENHTRLVSALETDADVAGAWRENALATLMFHSENPELTSLVYREAMGLDEHFASKVDELSSLARSRMMEEFQMVADRGLMIPCDVELVSTIVQGATVNIIMEYILRQRATDLGALADGLVRNQLRALTAYPPVAGGTAAAGGKSAKAPAKKPSKAAHQKKAVGA